MVQIKRKLSVAVIAVAVLCIVAAGIGYAYWTTSVQLTGNQAASGKLSMIALDQGQTTLAPVNIEGIMPGDAPVKKIVAVTSTSNRNVDLHFSVGAVDGTGTLKDNLMVAFAFMTDPTHAYWLKADGTTVAMPEITTEYTDANYQTYAAPLESYKLATWGGNDKTSGLPLTGYVGLDAAHSLRHVVMWYYLPINAASDCQDSSATFEMSFEFTQSH